MIDVGYLLLMNRCLICCISSVNDGWVLHMMNDLNKMDRGKFFFIC